MSASPSGMATRPSRTTSGPMPGPGPDQRDGRARRSRRRPGLATASALVGRWSRRRSTGVRVRRCGLAGLAAPCGRRPACRPGRPRSSTGSGSSRRPSACRGRPTITTPSSGASTRRRTSVARRRGVAAGAIGLGDHDHHVGHAGQLGGVVGHQQRRRVDDDVVEELPGGGDQGRRLGEELGRVVDRAARREEVDAVVGGGHLQVGQPDPAGCRSRARRTGPAPGPRRSTRGSAAGGSRR